ncbi:MAG: hypothetical protein FWH07_02250 [Oscillospiraceae bacterium]|nr:hypothetical protein [Oscillospiraceae bacterium]
MPIEENVAVEVDDEVEEVVEIEGIADEVDSVSEPEEITEEVDVVELAEQAIQPELVVSRNSPLALILAIVSIAIALAALIFSVIKTELTIGQGELFVESGVVNEMLGNLIRNDLSEKIPDNVSVRDINIRVVLFGRTESDYSHSPYSKVSDIGESDSVFAQVVFFPQESVEAFARDCRAVLDIMAESGVIYDEILFTGEDRSTAIHAEISGRFSADISVEQIMDITFYFGEIAVDN